MQVFLHGRIATQITALTDIVKHVHYPCAMNSLPAAD